MGTTARLACSTPTRLLKLTALVAAGANGVDWETGARAAAVRATGGYAYFIQACGSHVWAARATDTITLQYAQFGIEAARTEVEQGLYQSR